MSELATQIAEAGARDDTRPRTFQELLKAQQKSIERALPQSMSADRFLRVALTEANRTPMLRQCTHESILGGLMLSAQLGLEIGSALGQCYLIPRRLKGELTATFQIGYRGYQELAARNGWVVTTGAVRPGDEFDWQDGTNPYLVHRQTGEWDATPEWYWAVARKDGYPPVFQVWSHKRVIAHRDRFVQKWQQTPWADNEEAMARKTVAAAVSRGLQLAPEAQHAVQLDGQVIRKIALNIEDHEVEHEPVEAIETTVAEPDPEPAKKTAAKKRAAAKKTAAKNVAPEGNEYEGYPLADLKQMCAVRGLPSDGEADELVFRLFTDDHRAAGRERARS